MLISTLNAPGKYGALRCLRDDYTTSTQVEDIQYFSERHSLVSITEPEPNFGCSSARISEVVKQSHSPPP